MSVVKFAVMGYLSTFNVMMGITLMVTDALQIA